MASQQLRHQTLLLAVVIVGVVTLGRVRTESAAGGLPELTAQVAALKAAVNDLQQQVNNQSEAISSLQATVGDHTTRLQFVTVAGTEMFITGANVNIRDGSGSTVGANPSGLGNLIIGYNELSNGVEVDRTGSHNLVVGPGHSYTSFGGLVAGSQNSISGLGSSVTGGERNTASGIYSSVSSGEGNHATGARSSVSGGESNISSGTNTSVSGGVANTAGGDGTSVSGGRHNRAGDRWSSVSGGSDNYAREEHSSISGGVGNTVSGGGFYSSISGGGSIVLNTPVSWAAGGLHQP
jgi:hypothetical protein